MRPNEYPAPTHVGLEHAHSGVAHLTDDVALQQCGDPLFGMQVALRPEAYLHALGAGVFAQLAQILYVAGQRVGLSVAGTVSVVGQEPSEGHVVGGIAVDDGTGGELIVALLAVETLADASVVALALAVAHAVFEHDPLAGGVGGPVVAVVGVEMALVESEFRQQHRVAGELIEVGEKLRRSLVDHDEYVDPWRLMRETHRAGRLGAEVVGAFGKRVPHHSVAVGAPVEGGRGGNASVGP